MLNRVAKHKKILAIIAVVIFICEFFLLYLAWGNYTVRKDKEWEIKNSEYFSQTCERLDNTISTVKSLAQILFQEDSIQRYANDRFYNYEGMNFENITNVSKVISTYQSHFNYMDFSIAVSKIKDGMMIVNSQTMNLESGLKHLALDLDVLNKTFEQNSDEGMYFDVILNYKNSGDLSVVCKKVYSPTASVYIMFVFRYGRFLADIDNKMVVFNHTGVIQNPDKKINIDNLLTELDYTDKTSVISVFNKSGYKSLFYKTQSFGDCIYVYLYDAYRSISDWLVLLILVLFCAATSYYIAVFVIRVLYFPFARIFSRSFEEIKTDDDFIAAIENKISSMIDSNTDYLKLIKEKNQKLKDSFLIELTNGFLDPDNAEKIIDEFNLAYLKRPCRCILLSIMLDNLIEYDLGTENTALIEKDILSYVSGKVFEFSKGDIIRQKDGIYVFVVNTESDLKTQLERLIDEITTAFEAEIIMAVGQEVTEYSHINESYFDAIEILNVKQNRMESGVFFETGIKSEDNIYYPFDMEKNLIDFVVRRDIGKAKSLINYLISRNLEQKTQNSEAVNSFGLAIVLTIKRILHQLELKENDVFPDGMMIYLELKMCKNAEEISAKIMQLFEYILEYVNDGDESRSSNGKRIIQYIYDNYTSDISLVNISDDLKISVSLICRVLKDEYNTTFKECINRKRIAESCKIIEQNPNIKVEELAETVGYNNTKTFARVFKKYKGVVPSEYMQL